VIIANIENLVFYFCEKENILLFFFYLIHFMFLKIWCTTSV
jgi:hypothetical protein